MILTQFLSGVFFMGLATSSLIFFRCWKETNDKLFRYFALAFMLMALERIPLAIFLYMKEPTSWVYLFRLAGFLVLLKGIVEKNAESKKAPEATPPRAYPTQLSDVTH